jgi:hypothetical protein
LQATAKKPAKKVEEAKVWWFLWPESINIGGVAMPDIPMSETGKYAHPYTIIESTAAEDN